MPFTPTTFNTGAAPGIDAAVLNTMQTQYAEAMQSLINDIVNPFVIVGGVGTIHGGLPKQMDVTQCVYYANQPTDGSKRRRIVNATNFTTVTASTTYFLDYNADGTTSWATSHSGDANRVPIASVTTDGSGNIAVITDVRPINVSLFPAAIGLPLFAGSFIPLVGVHSFPGWTISAGNGVPGALAANEIYFQLT